MSRRKIGAFAVAAAIGLVAAACTSGTGGEERAATPPAEPPAANEADATAEDVPTPPTEPPAVNQPDATAEQVARDFVDALGAFDADYASTLLAADADITPLISSVGAASLEGTTQELQMLLSLLEAERYEQVLDSCEAAGSDASGTGVLCRFDFHLLGSDAIGLGPFGGSYFDLTVRDGQIARASMHWGTADFSPQMWEPFASWVTTTHPKDAAVMYQDESYSGARLTEASIRLWERRSRDYVAAKAPELVEIAESFMEARNAYDTEKALSFLADDGATAAMLFDNQINTSMPSVRLDRDELALAFEVERLYGFRYEPYECHVEHGPVAYQVSGDVICTYSLDSKLRRLAGYAPAGSAFGLGIRDGRINVLTFPWLNISWNPGGYQPAEFESFVYWLDAEHPEAIDAQNPLPDQPQLFRTMGQEWVLELNRKTLDLLKGYLEEYERSVTG